MSKEVMLKVGGVGGLEVAINQASIEEKQALIERAQKFTEIDCDFTCGCAAEVFAKLSDLKKLTEKSRKHATAPINSFVKTINAKCKEFIEDAGEEHRRLGKMVSDYQIAIERKQREEETERRRKEEEAKQKANEPGEVKGSFARALEAQAKKREDVKLKAQQLSQPATQTTLKDSGVHVKKQLDFECLDLWYLANNHPDLVEIVPKRAKILAALKEGKEIKGVKAFEKSTAVSRRSSNV